MCDGLSAKRGLVRAASRIRQVHVYRCTALVYFPSTIIPPSQIDSLCARRATFRNCMCWEGKDVWISCGVSFFFFFLARADEL
jgi:hypothetical protein